MQKSEQKSSVPIYLPADGGLIRFFNKNMTTPELTLKAEIIDGVIVQNENQRLSEQNIDGFVTDCKPRPK